jgi:SOS response regulatory protein OraA/RecX
MLSDSFITSAFIIESVVEMIQLQGWISEHEFGYIEVRRQRACSDRGF